MKLMQKLFVFVVLSTVSWLSIQGTAKANYTDELYSQATHHQEDQQFLNTQTSPFQVTLPENLITTTTTVYHRILKVKTLNTSLISIQNKNAIFCTTLQFVSHFKYICNYLKQSELLFPFHQFF